MVEVVSHRPGFLVDCAEALTARANRQQPNVIKVRVERIIPPASLQQIICVGRRPAPLYFTSTRERGERKIYSRPLGHCNSSQSEEGARNAAGSMANYIFFTRKVSGDAANTQSLNSLDIGNDRR
jgi:hypothetical protein